MIRAEVYLDKELLFERLYDAPAKAVEKALSFYIFAEGWGQAAQECYLVLTSVPTEGARG